MKQTIYSIIVLIETHDAFFLFANLFVWHIIWRRVSIDEK